MYRLITAIGIAATAFLAFGCGGGGEETASGGEKTGAANITKAQFIKQADAICAKVRKEREAAIAAYMKDYPGGATAAEENIDEGLKKVIAPSIQQEVEELEGLPVPAKDEAMVARMIENLVRGTEVLAEKGSQGLQKSGIPDFEREAAAYGFKACRYP